MSYLIIRQFWNFLFYARVYLKKKKKVSHCQKKPACCAAALMSNLIKWRGDSQHFMFSGLALINEQEATICLEFGAANGFLAGSIKNKREQKSFHHGRSYLGSASLCSTTGPCPHHPDTTKTRGRDVTCQQSPFIIWTWDRQ